MARRSRPRAHQRRLQNLRAATKEKAHDQARTWYRMKNFVDQPDTAAIYLYGEIGYWGVEAQDFVRDLMSLRVANIILHINSPGGEVFEGLAIYHALRDHPALVESRVDGVAASAASFIAMAGDTVVMQRNAQMMIHDASGIEYGNADDLRSYADLLDKCSDNLADIYMQQAGGTVEQWRTAMKAETWYSAAEALAAGLCDEVANADEETGETIVVVPGEEEPDELMAASYDLSIFTYAGREKAPAPVATIAEPVVPPAAEPVTEAEPVIPVQAPAPSEEATSEDEPVEAPGVVESPLVLGSDPDPWAALTSGLLDTNSAPSTVDELFAALRKKGIPA